MRVNDDEITCSHHGVQFCIKTGEVLCPPAYESINIFPTRIVNGIVQVKDNRWDLNKTYLISKYSIAIFQYKARYTNSRMLTKLFTNLN